MLQALLHGKLSREQENMEDILTSNVFGLLSYLPPAKGLLPFLAKAETLEGEKPLARLAAPGITEHVQMAEEDVRFWPWLEDETCDPCEPDLLLTIRSPGIPVMVLIEAKYRSGKSSEADEADVEVTDQLGRQWDHLWPRAKKEKAQPLLLFVTAHAAMPRAAIRKSIGEYDDKRGPAIRRPMIAWLSWCWLPSLFEKQALRSLKDLAALARRLGFEMFEGFPRFWPIGKMPWQFDVGDVVMDGPVAPTTRFTWPNSGACNPWRFA